MSVGSVFGVLGECIAGLQVCGNNTVAIADIGLHSLEKFELFIGFVWNMFVDLCFFR